MATVNPSSALRKYSPEKMAESIAAFIADRSRGVSRNDIIEGMGLQDVDGTTVYRWLTQARDMGLVEMTGELAQARWQASQELRRLHARQIMQAPLSKRPVVTYDEMWAAEYVPNKTFYLSQQERDQLSQRSRTGSAPLENMDRHDMSVFMCGLSYASSQMEGNSYSLLDTISLIENNLVKQGAAPSETQMILNHHQAVRFLIENINSPPGPDDITIHGRDVRALHSLLSDNLLKDPSMGGRFRGEPVIISESSYRPIDLYESIESSFNTVIEKAEQIEDPFEQSFFLLTHLCYLQPFIDCNKRTARVTCNIPLLRAGVAPMNWMDVSREAFTEGLLSIYELNETSLLSEVFVDGYMRSTERFNIMKQSRIPDEVVLKYAAELRLHIQQAVRHGDDSLLPSNVAERDRGAFLERVILEMEQLRQLNPATMWRYRLKEGDVRDWMRRESSASQRRPEQESARG